jgi:hypothetical protein
VRLAGPVPTLIREALAGVSPVQTPVWKMGQPISVCQVVSSELSWAPTR